MKSNLLIDERVFVIQPSLVRELGSMPKAMLVQQMHYILTTARKDLILDGTLALAPHPAYPTKQLIWARMTTEEWSEALEGMISPRSLDRFFRELTDEGVLFAQHLGQQGRTMGRTINYDHSIFQQPSRYESAVQELQNGNRQVGGLETANLAVSPAIETAKLADSSIRRKFKKDLKGGQESQNGHLEGLSLDDECARDALKAAVCTAVRGGTNFATDPDNDPVIDALFADGITAADIEADFIDPQGYWFVGPESFRHRNGQQRVRLGAIRDYALHAKEWRAENDNGSGSDDYGWEQAKDRLLRGIGDPLTEAQAHALRAVGGKTAINAANPATTQQLKQRYITIMRGNNGHGNG